jgi:hypothetical protein
MSSILTRPDRIAEKERELREKLNRPVIQLPAFMMRAKYYYDDLERSRARTREYQRKRRQRNPEAMAAYDREYQRKRRAEAKQRQAAQS